MTRSLTDQVNKVTLSLELKHRKRDAQDRVTTPPGELTAICDACGDVGKIAECTSCKIKICVTTTNTYLGCVLLETTEGEFVCPLCYFKEKRATPVHFILLFHVFCIEYGVVCYLEQQLVRHDAARQGDASNHPQLQTGQFRRSAGGGAGGCFQARVRRPSGERMYFLF